MRRRLCDFIDERADASFDLVPDGADLLNCLAGWVVEGSRPPLGTSRATSKPWRPTWPALAALETPIDGGYSLF